MTSLVSGARRSKSDLRVEAYGTVDEANAQIGSSRQFTKDNPDLDRVLELLQNDLFDLGADIASPERIDDGRNPELRICSDQVDRLETEIDLLNRDLVPLRSFVLPGGTGASAALHVARTVMRRAERLIVALNAIETEYVNVEAIKFANRASDLLFVAARVANENGARDVLWVPGANRT